MLTLPEVIKYTTLAKTTIYRYIRAGKFPAPVQVGINRVAWREEDIRNYKYSAQ